MGQAAVASKAWWRGGQIFTSADKMGMLPSPSVCCGMLSDVMGAIGVQALYG